jgi:hypothetical protein
MKAIPLSLIFCQRSSPSQTLQHCSSSKRHWRKARVPSIKRQSIFPSHLLAQGPVSRFDDINEYPPATPIQEKHITDRHYQGDQIYLQGTVEHEVIATHPTTCDRVPLRHERPRPVCFAMRTIIQRPNIVAERSRSFVLAARSQKPKSERSATKHESCSSRKPMSLQSTRP